MPQWEEKGEDYEIYFRHTPYPFDWWVLLMMNILNLINVMYIDQRRTKKLETRCYEYIRERF
jgi:hypothetical protein